MEGKTVTDAAGRPVVLTQTGSYFANVGCMTVAADGTITTQLMNAYEGADPAVAAIAAEWVKNVDDMLGEEIAVGDHRVLTSATPLHPASAASA